jgi:hypothetical protein
MYVTFGAHGAAIQQPQQQREGLQNAANAHNTATLATGEEIWQGSIIGEM